MRKLLLSLLLFASPVWGAIAIDDTSALQTGFNVSTEEVTIDIANQSGSAIYCAIMFEISGSTISSVTFDPGGGNEFNLSLVTSDVHTSTSQEIAIYAGYDTDLPTSATGETVRATFTSGPPRTGMICRSYYGSDVAQSVPTGAQISTNEGTGTSLSTGSVTSLAASDQIFTAYVQNCNSCGATFSSPAGADTNTIANQDNLNSISKVLVNHTDTVAGSVSPTLTSSVSETWVGAAVVVGAAASGPTATIDDDTPTINQEVTVTLSEALAGGNPTKAVFGTGDEVTCTSATSTTCTFTFSQSLFTATGALNNTPTGLTTVKLSDGTNESQTDNVTIGVSSAQRQQTVACTPPTCDDGYQITTPMTTGDTAILLVDSGCSISDFTTHGVPYFNSCGSQTDFTVLQWDVSAGAWLAPVSDFLASGCNRGVIRTPNVHPPLVWPPVSQPNCT